MIDLPMDGLLPDGAFNNHHLGTLDAVRGAVHLISNGSDMTRSRRRLRTPASCAKKSSRVVFERRSSRLGGRSNRLWSSFEAASERRRSDACRPLHYDELGSFMTLRARLIVGP